MKKNNLTIILLLIASFAFSQSPFSFNYQAVARDAQGQVLKNQSIRLKISILDGGNTNSQVFKETHQVTSSNIGIINLLIGKGQNQNGDISNLNWKTKKYWLKVEMDASGGSNYALIGTTQLVSVPYALHAETATHVDDADANPSNELQQLSFNTATNELSISNGNKITIPTGGTDADADPQNEIQTISKNGNTVTLSKNGGSFTDTVDDEDADRTNELQTLNLSGNTLQISNGNQVDLTSFKDNTDAQSLSINGYELSISGGNKVMLPGSSTSSSDKITDADGDTKVQVEKTINDNKIHFDIFGTERFQMEFGRLKFLNSSNNILIGDAPQLAFDDFSKSNIAIGAQALALNKNRSNLVAIGDSALYNNSVGAIIEIEACENTAVGSKALFSNTTGAANTAIGYDALKNNTVGYSNVAIGKNALKRNTDRSGLIAIGINALANNSTGAQVWQEAINNIAIGDGALYKNTTGFENTAVGSNSQNNNIDGYKNTSIGSYSLNSNTEGYKNTAIGTESLYSNKEGLNNTAIGEQALRENIHGSNNTAIGINALKSSKGANGNTAAGSYSLKSNTSGYSNSAFGSSSLEKNTLGNENVANGYQALYYNNEGHYNTAVGFEALYENRNGGSNTAIGNWASRKNTTGSNNTAIGISALHTNQTGDYNTVLGNYAGYSSIGYRNIFIGNHAGYYEEGDDKLYIDNSDTQNPLIHGDFESDKLTINGNLEVTNQIKISSSSNTPEAGMIRWNSDTEDFEGYTGNSWRSLTKQNSFYGSASSPSIDVTENQKITLLNGAEEDYLGASVATDGIYSIAGIYGDDILDDKDRGSAVIYKRVSDEWIIDEGLIADDGAEGDLFGFSVSISGDYAIVGAPNADIGNENDQGAAYIFKRNGSTWEQQAKITIGEENQSFGYSVAISDDYAVIGSPNSAIYDGYATIYKREGINWNLQSVIYEEATYLPEARNFGYSVSISGNYIVIGEPGDDLIYGIQDNTGLAHIYFNNGIDWVKQAEISPSAFDIEANAYFGKSVSISGSYVIVGAAEENIGLTIDQGAAYIFKRNGTNWVEQAKLTASDGAFNDEFGNSVSITGDFAIVGSHQDDVESNGRQGSAYIYKREGANWTQYAHLTGSDSTGSDYFGESVSISYLTVIVGAYKKDIDVNDDVGGVYFFDK